jgi:hypothetical protein
MRQVQFAPDAGAYAACRLSLVLVVHRPFALFFAFALQRATAIAICNQLQCSVLFLMKNWFAWCEYEIFSASAV